MNGIESLVLFGGSPCLHPHVVGPASPVPLISSDLLSIPTAPPLLLSTHTARKSSQNLIQWDFPDLVFLDLQSGGCSWLQLVEIGPRIHWGFPQWLTPR